MRGLASRADLLRILVEAPEALGEAAGFIGYERDKLALESEQRREPESGDVRPPQDAHTRSEASPPGLLPLAPVPFWRLVECRVLESLAEEKAIVRARSWRGLAQTAPRPQPLSPLPELIPRLRGALAVQAPRSDLDIRAVVRRISKGKPIDKWPRRRRRRWPSRLHILEDFASRLIPLWGDQKLIRAAIAGLLPKHGLEHSRLEDGLSNGAVFGNIPGGEDAANSDAPILVFSDLGLLGAGSKVELQRWLQFARERHAEGRRCIALTPAPPQAYPHSFRRAWTLVQWESDGADALLDGGLRDIQAERLLGLLSHAVKMPPGLVRDVRRLALEMSVITEIDLWRSQHISTAHPNAAVLRDADRLDLHQHFREASPELRRKIFGKIRHWCGGERESIYLEAVIGLGALADEVADPEVLDAAASLIQDMAEALHPEDDASILGDITTYQIKSYFTGLRRRTHDAALQVRAVREAYSKLCIATEKDNRKRAMPAGFDPTVMGPGGERHRLDLTQKGETLIAVASPSAAGEITGNFTSRSESLLASIVTRNDALAIWPTPFWKSGAPPAWAADYGADDFGAWSTFAVTRADGTPVRQRMRWIQPGRFLMGSPPDEPGRYDESEYEGRFKEGPQHEVRLSKGYWLFDTPVTQELWTAVMGDNPSHFKDPKRPVEQVSWDDAQKFLERINELVPGLDLVLPTEAQWEYACRAGTDTATYAGPIEILGKNNAPVLDQIAWYGGNSGVGFELENGYDSSGWQEKQYEHNRAGTRPVGLKSPNHSGLYDMLGNVWEWCADDLRPYAAEPVSDPAGSLSGASRALRGGSWSDSARYVRSASRYAYDRDYRIIDIGFRCARVRPGAEPAEPGPSQAERELAPGLHGEARLLYPDAARGKTSAVLPVARGFVVRSDCEILAFGRVTRPPWASAMGRDRFGLWVDFEFGDARQRMRWIGPGRILMGSPEDEPGRYDDEGPQHEVRLSQGYWLFDTPVIQALWLAVMGKNPSYFVDPKRPVEQVSWDDVQQFLERVNELVPGLDLVLPTEAQWEYACRAGTDTATYAGPIEILGEHNAPVLDAIAWYGGNSGVGFELEKGYDSSGWEQKQYKDNRAGTRSVGLKSPNPWGLYDMLGNVWEWCADDLRPYSAEPVSDPVGPLSGAERALRGGSWDDLARRVRSANRLALVRGHRFNYIGFRCARVRP